MKKKKGNKKGTYYYIQYMGECPVCWKDASYKVRVYGKKPKDWDKTHVWLPDTQTYDHCM